MSPEPDMLSTVERSRRRATATCSSPSIRADILAAAERSRRRSLAWLLAISHFSRIAALINDRRSDIIRRFPPDEQSLVSSEWPVGLQFVAACLPEAIEVMLDVLAEGISPKLFDQVARRCTRTETDTPPSSSSPASPSSG